MKKILKAFVDGVAVIVTLASCTKDAVNSEAVPMKDGKIDIRVSAVMGELTPVEETKATTHTVIRLNWDNGDKVYAYDAGQYLGSLNVMPSDNKMYATLTSPDGGITAPAGDLITLVYFNSASCIIDSDSDGAPDIDASGNILFDFKMQNDARDPFVVYGTLNVSETSEAGGRRSVTGQTVPFEFATSFMTISATGIALQTVDSVTVSGINTVCKLSVKNDGAPTVTGEKDASSSPITRKGNVFTQPTEGNTRAMFTMGVVPDNNSGRKITVYQAGDKRYGDDFSLSSEIKSKQYRISVYEMTAIPSYQITGSASPAASGAVTFKRGGSPMTTAYAGDVITVVPTPAEGYEVDEIAAKDSDGGDVTVTGNSFTMPAKNVEVTVTFKQIEYAIDKASATNGSFVVKKGEVDVIKACYQDEMTVEATPETGYTVDKITVTDSDGGDVTVTGNSFTMPAKGVTVAVTFKKADYTITKATVLFTGGAFTVKKGGVEASSAQYGDAVKIEVTSTPANYEFDRMEVTKTDDATTKVTVTDGTFTMPAYPVTVTVSFKPTGGASHTTELEKGGLL